ncbi:uncharacterized protein LOC142325762 [Lycorma delicatula]|uniref:uncharacterized protein LOC142325762 n=1 Tax=Lycorma delicatula TaxID=130591 RepID=UPI003F511E05
MKKTCTCRRRQRDEEERLQVITPKTPLKKQIEMVEEHKEILRKGLDQFETELGDDAFKFLTDLPLSTSDSNLLEIGSYRFSNENSELLLEVYPAELIDLLQEFLVVSKKEIEKRLRTRHEKIIKGFYAEYSAEIERGLREYKEARLEWATVYQVVAELKETLSQREAKDADTNVSFDAGNRPTGVLVSSLNDAKKRQKTQYENGQALDAKKVELHKEIHDRAMFHMHEIEKMQSHVDKLTTELCLLRRDARKKQMVIQSLYMQSGKNMMR